MSMQTLTRDVDAAAGNSDGYWPRCIKFAFERKSEKSNASPKCAILIGLKLNLHLIFLICV